MFYELTNMPVKKFVILMACEDGECVVYEEYDKKKYIGMLSRYIRNFVEHNLSNYG
jgi:genome maintenance exonuclease 1